MSSPMHTTTFPELAPLPVLPDGLPILYEDEEEADMGESNPHVVSDEILHLCLKFHLAGRPELQVFSNMNVYYRDDPPHPRTGSLPYVSPDVMVVRPFRLLPKEVKSYTIGRDGPTPLAAAEILSERSGQQRDLKEKLVIYAKLGVPEYLLVDPTGRYGVAERLLLKRLRPDRTWEDVRDSDGGVTSLLGFRVILDNDGELRVLDAATGKRYARPDEAQAEADARRQVEERLHALETELERLRQENERPQK